MKSILKRNTEAFWARYERDRVSSMTPEQWGEWINSLPMPEFMAMVSLRSAVKHRASRGRKAPLSPKRKALCIRLAGIAAFHVTDPSAQKAIYAAVRELQR